MKNIRMLRGCAAMLTLSVVVGCTGSVGASEIEPITVVGADGGDTSGLEADADAARPDGGAGDDIEVPADTDPTGADGGHAEAVDAGGSAAGYEGAEVVGGDGEAAADGIDATIDVTTVPDTITPAYVQAVLAELEALYAGALASHVAAGEPTLETTTKLGSAFSEPAYDGRLQHFIRIGEEGFVEIADADRIRPRTHTDVQLLAVDDGCVYAETRLDVSPVRKDPLPVVESFVYLGPRDREIFDDVNPTPWLIHKMPGGDPEGLRELDPCVE